MSLAMICCYVTYVYKRILIQNVADHGREKPRWTIKAGTGQQPAQLRDAWVKSVNYILNDADLGRERGSESKR